MSQTNKVLLINGPNLNMLGLRESGFYGSSTLGEIENDVILKAKNHNLEVIKFQSNIEGEICTFIQNNLDSIGIIINAGAYTHTSIAILDALKIVKNGNPNSIIVEVHLSNIYKRESFRHNSYTSQIADATITGMQKFGYIYALDFIVAHSKLSS